MRQLTEREKEALIINMAMLPVPDSNTERRWFTEGFQSGLEYQDKRIEALEAEIKELERLLEFQYNSNSFSLG